MTYYSLSFRIDFFTDWEGYTRFEQETDASIKDTDRRLAKMAFERMERVKIYHSLGSKLYSEAWADIDFNDNNALLLQSALQELEAKHVGFLGSGTLLESYSDLEKNTCEWFLLNPTSGEFSDFSLYDSYPTCKAYRYLPEVHILRGCAVSEKFKTVVEKHELTGLDFLWVKDTGKYRAQQWYLAIASESMGRGLDHPWYDREQYRAALLDETNTLGFRFTPADKADQEMYDTKLRIIAKSRQKGLEYLSSDCATGNPGTNNLYLRPSWTTGSSVVDAILAQFPKKLNGLTIVGPPRFQRNYIPRTDFAYCGGGDLICSQKARNILLSELPIDDSIFIGVMIYDVVPVGMHDYDAGAPRLEPICTPERLTMLRQKEKLFLEEYLKQEKPIRKPDIKRSLQLLRSRKKYRRADFNKGLSKEKAKSIINAIPYKLPELWQEVLILTNGFVLRTDDTDFEFKPIEELLQYHEDMELQRKQADDDYADDLMYFGKTFCGDSLAFEKDINEETADSIIVLISHEDFTIQRKWEGVAEFLEDVLTKN